MPARGAELRAEPKPRLFRAVWRWHFYAGLLVIPIVVILSLSGIVYLFKPQIDSVFYGNVRNVDDGGAPRSYAAQLTAVKAALPGASVARAQRMGMPPGTTIAFPADRTSSYAVSFFPDNDVEPNQSALRERFAFVDQYTARPVGDFRYGQFGAMAQATDFGIALHEGRQYGIWSRLFALFGTLALLLSCATAIVMWRKRRPQGIGAPRRAPGRRLGAGVVAITFGLGVLFPLLGLSIVVLLILDLVVVRRIPPLRRALGATP